MKIERIDIQNFGIIHNANFDISGENGNLVFINGLNGRGKTTLQSAIRWCFFGDEPVSTTKFASRYGINKLQEGESLTVQVSTEISLDSGVDKAFIERSQLFTRQPNGVPKKLGSPKLVVKTKTKDSGALTDVAIDPELWIAEYFPKRLINFFLFDGEKMTNFFQANVKDEIEKAIREIAGVDLFDGVAINLQTLESQLNRRIAKLTGSKTGEIEAKRATEESIRQGIMSDYQTALNEFERCERRLKEINTQLGDSQDMQAVSSKLEDIEVKLTATEKLLEDAQRSFSLEILKGGITGMIIPAFEEVRNQVEKAKKEDRLPPAFEPERIRDLLSRGKCICGCEIERGDARFTTLEELIERHAVASDVGKILDSTSRESEKISFSMSSTWNSIQTSNSQIAGLSKQKNAFLAEREQLTRTLQGSDIATIRALATEKEVLEKKKDKLRDTKASLKVQFEHSDEKFRKLDKEFAEAAKGNQEAEALRSEAIFVHEVAEAARKIHGIAIGQVREELQKAIEEKFSVVKAGKFKTVISPDFEVLTLNEDGSKVDLSEGESMAKAYIFSLALRDVINLGFPLIVDTPFGRLSGDFRAWLSEVLSTFILKEVENANRQIIFLMTDTEYTPYTKGRFAKASPLEFYLAYEAGNETDKSVIGKGIDPEWMNHDYWKDWAGGRIK